jgi:PAS domain S-box-containing protein
MTKETRTPFGQYTMIWTGLLIGLGFYFADIIVDVFVFDGGTLLEQLLKPSYPETWMRTCVLVLAIAFGIYAQVLLRRERGSAEHAKTAERFLNSIVDNIPSMVFIKDARDLRFVRVNRSGERLLGLTNQDLVGKNDHDVFPESQADFFTRKDREVLESGIELNIPEEEIDTASTGKRWLHTRKVPILDETGQPIYLLGISVDITESKQRALELKKTETRFETLFNSAADYIFVIDPDGRITETNRYACEQSGYPKHEIIGKHIKTFFTKKSQDVCDCNFPGLRQRGYNQADVEFRCKDGKICKMECVATAVPDESGRFTSFLIIQRDVTLKKRAEEEMQRHRQELAHVMRLSSLGEMASGIAHELNQPLTALMSYCGTAAEMVTSLQPASTQLNDILERARKEASRASAIIRNLREFVSTGNNQEEYLEIDRIVHDTEGLLDFELRHANVRLEKHLCGPTCKVLANKVQIEQVLINLIRNSLDAIKIGETTAGTIVLQTRLLPKDFIEVSVTDNGPGIEPDMTDKLFRPFQTNKAFGMGMGLSISRSIIEAHGGKLWADTQRRNGAAFGFTLPCVSETQP